jgi:carnitine 3-dehydrogenase
VSQGGRPSPADVRTVAIIGTGVIGAGWAAHFLRMGYDVVGWDPGARAEERLGSLVDTAWPSLERLGLRDGASRDRLRFSDTLAGALAGADFVQESAPEVLDDKVALLASIDAATPAGVVVASSTSGFMMSDMAVGTATPGRFVVGHPFNPPYLIPIVEVVGGQDTDPDVVAWAETFYTLAGKVTLTMDREIPGFVGNRLQEALWREALHMIDSGQATVQQIDDSITYGPGPALGADGALPDLPPGRRAGRHGAHARPLRAGAARALDPADSARAHPPAARPGRGGRRRVGRRHHGPRAGGATRRVPGRSAAVARKASS